VATDIKVALPPSDISNLLVLMQVLREERLDLGFVCFTHGLGRDFDLIAILVASFGSEIVDFLNGI
jgi:hypothetical protein